MAKREDHLQMALINAMAQAVDAEAKEVRAKYLKVALEAYEEEGGKVFDVFMPGEELPIGKITLKQPSEEFEVDTAALIAWALENAPQMLETVEVPAVAATTYKRLWPASLAALQERATKDPITGEVRDGDVVVEGLKYKPAGKPTSFGVTFVKGKKEALLEAYRKGTLGIAGPEAVRMVTDGEDVPPWER